MHSSASPDGVGSQYRIKFRGAQGGFTEPEDAESSIDDLSIDYQEGTGITGPKGLSSLPEVSCSLVHGTASPDGGPEFPCSTGAVGTFAPQAGKPDGIEEFCFDPLRISVCHHGLQIAFAAGSLDGML